MTKGHAMEAEARVGRLERAALAGARLAGGYVPAGFVRQQLFPFTWTG